MFCKCSASRVFGQFFFLEAVRAILADPRLQRLWNILFIYLAVASLEGITRIFDSSLLSYVVGTVSSIFFMIATSSAAGRVTALTYAAGFMVYNGIALTSAAINVFLTWLVSSGLWPLVLLAAMLYILRIKIAITSVVASGPTSATVTFTSATNALLYNVGTLNVAIPAVQLLAPGAVVLQGLTPGMMHTIYVAAATGCKCLPAVCAFKFWLQSPFRLASTS